MGHLASRLPLSLLLAALLAPGAARANGFALDIQGNFSNGTASAGAASTHDPAGMLANPAILAHLDGVQVVVGGQYIAGASPFTNDGSTLAVGAPIGGANGDGAQSGAAPWVFASYRVAPSLAVGFSFYAPFGTATKYGRDFVGRYQGVESTVESIAFGPAVAWKPVDRVAIGVSVAARRDHAILGNALDLGSLCVAEVMKTPGVDVPTATAVCGAPPYGVTPGASDGYGRYTAYGWGWTATGGVTVEPAAGTLLGAGYRHESTSKVKGHMAFDASAAGFLTGVGYTINGDPAMSLKVPLPDFATVSLQQKLGDSFQLLAAFQYTFWSRFDTLELTLDDPANGITIPASKQGFRNAFRVSGAGVYTVRPGLDVFAGLAFEQSPITTKYRQVTLPERDTVLAGVGAEGRVWSGLSLGATYQRVQPLGKAKIDLVDASGEVKGTVNSSANVVVLQLTWRS
jgi:long-chain fatty acid transport protein